MYSGNIARIYNVQSDALEYGTPKRVIREEQHLGEMMASTKKRVTWRFTLGESDRMHEVVLVHSVMSHKKLVQFDGRQVHFSSTRMVGDWSFSMILDGLKMAMEVRISELESADIPKYDLVMNRIPFRRWDVYRRKKHAVAMAASAQPTGSSGNAYGTQHWGPGGATPSGSQNKSQQNSGSLSVNTREAGVCSLQGSYANRSLTSGQTQCVSASYRTSPGQSDGRTRSYSGHKSGQHSLPQTQNTSSITNAAAANAHQQERRSAKMASKPETRPEVNLIDDLVPSVSVSAQSLIFDPLARAKLSSTKESAASTACQQQQYQAPLIGAVPVPSTCVDPFASVAPSAVTKPAAIVNSSHPFAASNSGNYQHQQQLPMHQISTSNANQVTAGYQQRLVMGTAMGAPMGRTIAMQQRPGTCGFYTGQQHAVPNGMGSVNLNNDITQLMNPASLETSHRNEKSKSIDIDAFAGIGR